MPEQNSENLKDSDLCPICHGTGWAVREIDGKSVASQCRCYQKSVLERRIRFAELPEKLKGMRLSSFSINAYQTPCGKEKARIACKIIKQYLDNFTEEKTKNIFNLFSMIFTTSQKIFLITSYPKTKNLFNYFK